MKTISLSLLLRTLVNICVSYFLVSSAVLANKEQNWNFRVFLDENEIGYHNVSLSTQDDIKRVRVEANFAVKFLFIKAYEYQHQTQESWNGACLTNITSDTNDNGKMLFLRTKPLHNGVELTTHNGETELQGCIRSFAYWNPELLKTDRLLNTQTGEYESVRIDNLGMNSIEIDGQTINAQQYRLKVKDKSIDLWYTADMNWLALQTTVRGGRRLSYFPAGTVSQ